MNRVSDQELFAHSESGDRRAYSFCGTIEYMAPEVVKGGNVGHDIAVDWWSLGVLTYELLTGASPFTVEGDRNTQQDISHRILNREPLMPYFLGPDVKDFILRLLVKDPRKRLGGGPTDAQEVKSHKFFCPINWDDLLRKNIPAPFIPKITSTMDVSNFSEEFTNMPVVDSPSAVPAANAAAPNGATTATGATAAVGASSVPGQANNPFLFCSLVVKRI